MDYKKHNQKAWNDKVHQGDMWTKPVSSDEVDRGRQGVIEIVLTPLKKVPRSWFPDRIEGIKILCLASGGGQQGPILAAAGGDVTVLDYSPRQLEQDRMVAERDGLAIETIQGDMMDLSMFENESFDLIVHPWSNCFVSDVNPVWQECYRVLKRNGILMSGFGNPVNYIFDNKAREEGRFILRHKIPYADSSSLTDQEYQEQILDTGEPTEFGHSLEDQIGGQLRAGFILTDMYEDNCGGYDLLDQCIDVGIATRVLKG